MTQTDELVVLITGDPAGTLHRSRDAITFAYDSEYLEDFEATPLSTAMPIDQRVHAGEHVAAWIDGLLPDNERVRFLWGREFGVDEHSPFDLLATKVGHDCAGAAQFCRPDDLDDLMARGGSQYPVTEDDIADHLRELVEDSARWHRRGALGGRFSLGGAQAKFALHQDDRGQWWQPESDTPTTHIFKPPIPGLGDQALVEHLTMETARRLGLPTARSQIAEFDGQQAIIVERCDRRRTADGMARLHQEDFCQALGLRPQRKYQRGGGPTPTQIADHLWGWSTDPERDVARFAEAVLYNWLIVAPDAHAKNYSILLRGDEVTLAPLYDVCSFLPWLPDGQAVDDEALSMSVGDGFTVGDADSAHLWEGAAVRMDLDPDGLVSRAVELAEDLEEAVTETVADIPAAFRRNPRADALLAWAAKRSARCLEVFVG